MSLPTPTVLRTETAYYCPTCGHEAANHAASEGYGCCFKWCPCQHTRSVVTRHGEPRERTVWASYWTGKA